MTQYIDKSDLVAEIERWRDGIKKGIFSIPLTGRDRTFATFEYEILGKIKDFLDTLETKEVDLYHELDKYFEQFKGLEKINWNWRIGSVNIHAQGIYDFARHFYELGLQVNNPVTAADRGFAEEIIINLKRVENDYHLDLTREMEWLRNKTKKGE